MTADGTYILPSVFIRGAMQEHIIETQHIYSGRLIHLDSHRVQLPDGNESVREIIQHPGAVAIVALDEAQNIYLIRQFRFGADRILYEIPAGILEPDEIPANAAIRELQEEIGYKPTNIKPLGGIFVAPGYTTEYIHLFIATELVPDALERDVDEFIEVVPTPLIHALAMVENGEIVDSKTVVGILRIARTLGI